MTAYTGTIRTFRPAQLGPRRPAFCKLGSLREQPRDGLAPAHRQIAEFLAARHVSRRIEDGLPIQRVLALITGSDGELMGPFRNFGAWLAVHNRPSRKQLSRLNPERHVLRRRTGHVCSVNEKRDILVNLHLEAHWNPDCISHRALVRPGAIGIGRSCRTRSVRFSPPLKGSIPASPTR